VYYYILSLSSHYYCTKMNRLVILLSPFGRVHHAASAYGFCTKEKKLYSSSIMSHSSGRQSKTKSERASRVSFGQIKKCLIHYYCEMRGVRETVRLLHSQARSPCCMDTLQRQASSSCIGCSSPNGQPMDMDLKQMCL